MREKIAGVFTWMKDFGHEYSAIIQQDKLLRQACISNDPDGEHRKDAIKEAAEELNMSGKLADPVLVRRVLVQSGLI